MSLDIKLLALRKTDVFGANLTHNLTVMAMEAGLYEALWRPEDLKIANAGEMAPLLGFGLEKLKADPERFKKLNPANGWGTYEGLVRVVENYLEACVQNPDAEIKVRR